MANKSPDIFRRDNKSSLVPKQIEKVEGGHYDDNHFYRLPDGSKIYTILIYSYFVILSRLIAELVL